MTEHLDVLIPIAIGFYMFLLGMGLPLPPKQGKGSKTVACVGLLVIFIASFLMTAPPKKANEAAVYVAKKLKESVTLPVEEEEGLSLIDITAREDTLVYVFKINKGSVEAKKLAGILATKVTMTACESPDYRTMLKNGLSVEMDYQDKDGKEAGVVTVRPRMCKM